MAAVCNKRCIVLALQCECATMLNKMSTSAPQCWIRCI